MGVAKGLRHLQAALGLPQTGLEGEQERMLIKKGKCVSPVKTSSPKRVQSSNPFVELFSPPARYDPFEPNIEVFAPSSKSRPSAPYRERKKSGKIKKKLFLDVAPVCTA